MAEKGKATIVIKKIDGGGAGHHGGAWKVALADFMTAMMAFFLLMWLLSQNEETKKAVSDYFSTPSMIEYNFSAYGAEITLEKLFLDLSNEPLKALQEYLEPANPNPNLLDLGSKKVVEAHITDQLQDVAQNLEINSDSIEFDIPDQQLFEEGTAKPSENFVPVMEKVKTLTKGLEEANITIFSLLFEQAVANADPALAKRVADERLSLVQKKIEAALEHDTVDVKGVMKTQVAKTSLKDGAPKGFIRLKIKQKEKRSDGRKPRKLEDLFGAKDQEKSPYDSFAKQVGEMKHKPAKPLPKAEVKQEIVTPEGGPASEE